MKLIHSCIKIRLPFAVLLSLLLTFSLNIPLLAYADIKTESTEESIAENEPSSNKEITLEGELEQEGVGEKELFGGDVLSQTTLTESVTSSAAIEPMGSISPFAVGDVFVATIDVDNGGTISTIPCTYKVTDATPSNLQAQIGDGTVTAISTATTGALIIPTTVIDTGTSTTYNVTSIGDYALRACGLLTGTGLGSNSTIALVGNNAFWDCDSLTDTGLGSNSAVTTVGNSAFEQCDFLLTTGLATNSTVTSLGASAFESCFALSSTGLGSNTTLTSLSNSVFDSCYGLTDTGLATNTTLTSIGESAFYACIDLADTGLGSNSTISSLGGSAFAFCITLTNTGLATNSTIAILNFSTFAFCEALTDTGLASNTTITSLGNSAFRFCPLLGTVGTPSTNQGDLVLNSQITSIGSNTFGDTSYERIYLLAPTSSSITVGGSAFNFLGGQGDLFVPETWDEGTSPITFSDGQYTYSNVDDTLVVMYAPIVTITIIDISRISGTANQANVTFQVNMDSDVIIRDSTGTILWADSVPSGVPFTAILSGLSSDFISGLTIEATGGSITYPDGITPRIYNTVTGVGTEVFAVSAVAYTVIFNGNGADNNDAMLADTMFLTYGQAATLVANVYTRNGYTFLGWNTEADGSGAFYTDEASILNLTNVQDGVITLYAQWKAESVVSPTGTTQTSTSLPQTSDALFSWMFLITGVLFAACLCLAPFFGRRMNRTTLLK